MVLREGACVLDRVIAAAIGKHEDRQRAAVCVLLDLFEAVADEAGFVVGEDAHAACALTHIGSGRAME